jgi:hypothetical protein
MVYTSPNTPTPPHYIQYTPPTTYTPTPHTVYISPDPSLGPPVSTTPIITPHSTSPSGGLPHHKPPSTPPPLPPPPTPLATTCTEPTPIQEGWVPRRVAQESKRGGEWVPPPPTPLPILRGGGGGGGKSNFVQCYPCFWELDKKSWTKLDKN